MDVGAVEARPGEVALVVDGGDAAVNAPSRGKSRDPSIVVIPRVSSTFEDLRALSVKVLCGACRVVDVPSAVELVEFCSNMSFCF